MSGVEFSTLEKRGFVVRVVDVGLGFGFRVSNLGLGCPCREEGLGIRVWGARFWEIWFRASVFENRVWCLGLEVWGSGVWL